MATKPIKDMSLKSGIKKKLVPLQISKDQKRKLSKLKVLAGRPAARLVRDGAKYLPNIFELPSCQGPFSEQLNLKISTVTIEKLDSISNKSEVSRAEIVRRIIDEAFRLWEEEEEYKRSMPTPYSSIFAKILDDQDGSE
jgi:hypothetical protein